MKFQLELSSFDIRSGWWQQVQKQTRLCITRDLTEKDVVSRIMRKENYLIGMLNKVSRCGRLF